MTEPTATVGETRTMLGILSGIPRDHIRHYAIAIDADEGTVLKFCCDDREVAARMLSQAAKLVVTQPGTAAPRGGPVPSMPTTRPPVICLCGPARHGVAYQVATTALAITGATVIGTPDMADALARLGPAEMRTAIDAIRAAHLRLIDLADQIHVINPGGRIGDDTRAEIAYATERGKPVTYLEAIHVS